MNTKITESFNNEMLDFISRSPTPYHAVINVRKMLDAGGFVELKEAQSWQLQPKGRYYIVRRDSSLIAFVQGSQPMGESGIRILGAHTDSPCLKVKPNPDINKQGYQQLGVAVYGGALLAPWFDRDLSLAGRVSVINAEQQLEHHIIDIRRPIAVIPSLAIHLDRTVNESRSINPHEQMPPLVWQLGEGAPENFTAWLKGYMQAQGVNATQIMDFDLSFYDVQAGSTLGINNEFIACARLDNLLSCFLTVHSLLQANSDRTSLVVLNDHEEVGSGSTAGAAGNFLTATLDRLITDSSERHQAEANSLMMSVDNAHGIHPNFATKHDANLGPQLNAGPVLKFDVNQSYASQSDLSSRVRVLAKQVGVPLQSFMIRADMRCGSTIGPITAAATGIETLDIGVPTFAMHSIRELAGSKDSEALAKLLTAFLNN
nr:M18 family aminopeptidase [Marinagarivorans algicola]